MLRPNRRFWFSFCYSWALLAICLAEVCGQTNDWEIPERWRADTELTDIVFVSESRGWAIGDQGMLLSTSDGGAHWESVDLNIQCRLESIYFINEQVGWIAGGYQLAGASTTQAVVLKTIDGGAHWQQIPTMAIPKLNRVHFTDLQNGWAIGHGNGDYPTGIFHSQDGGRTWMSPTEGALQSWQTGDGTQEHFAVANGDGINATVSHDHMQAAFLPEREPNVIRQIELESRQQGFAVGDRGAVLSTRNGGLSWREIPRHWGEAAELGQGQVDLNTLHVSERFLWVAGNPGTFIYRFDRETEEWTKARTQVAAGIRKLFFLNSELGWAVGSCGNILNTTDGGLTWRLQRTGPRQFGVVQIVQNPQQLSPIIFAKYCGEEGHLGATLLVRQLNDKSIATRPRVSGEHPIDLVRQASHRVGASLSAEVTTFEPSGIENEGSDIQTQRERIVRFLRTYQPHVVVVAARQVNQEDFQSLVLSAVQQAADAQRFPEQIETLELAPWTVDRVVVHQTDSLGDFRLLRKEYLPQSGRLLGDYTLPSEMLLDYPANVTNSATALTTLWSSSYRDSPLLLDGRQAPRRRAYPAGNAIQTKRLVNKEKILRVLNESIAPNESQTGPWLGRVAEILVDLDEATAGVWLYELAMALESQSQAELAANTHSFLVERYPNHPLTLLSCQWLFRNFSSTEMALWKYQYLEQTAGDSAGQGLVTSSSPASTRVRREGQGGEHTLSWEVVPQAETASAKSDASEASSSQSNTPPFEFVAQQRFRMARAISRSLDSYDAGSGAMGTQVLSRAKLNQKLSPEFSNERRLRDIAYRTPYAWVAERAHNEIAITNQQMANLPAALMCSVTNEKPWLDGHLNEACWQQARQRASQVEFATPRGETETLLIACNGEFLFLGAECYRSGTQMPKATKRLRDEALQAEDRIEILIDVDRDFAVSFRFVIDSTGRLADICGDHPGWDPTWYSCTHQENDRWFVEAAIPLEELGIDGKNLIYGIAVQRWNKDQLTGAWPSPQTSAPQTEVASRSETMPVQFQASGAKAPLGFGYLTFQNSQPVEQSSAENNPVKSAPFTQTADVHLHR